MYFLVSFSILTLYLYIICNPEATLISIGPIGIVERSQEYLEHSFVHIHMYLGHSGLIAKGNFKVQKAAPEGQYKKVSR